MSIYIPSDDSYLLAEAIKKYLINLTKNINKQTSKTNRPSRLNFHKTINIRYKNKIKNKTIKILDIGSGSGIQAETCRKLGFNNILTSDINKEAVILLRKQGFKSKQSNLFEKIKDKFNLIIFNPPYLPEDKLEPKDSKTNTTAGKKGNELIIKFLKQAKKHLNENGKIFLLFSSLSQPNIIKKQAKAFGYNLNLLSKKKLFFEELFVYELKQ